MGERSYLPLQVKVTFINTQFNKDYKSRFLGLLSFGLIVVIISRIYETLTLYFYFNPAKLWKSEAFGLLQDILLCLGIFSLLYPLYKKLFTAKDKNKLFIFDIIFVILCIAHLVILEYFFYQMEPLDVFVLGHTPSEIAFSLNTSSLSFKRLFIGLIVTILILIIGIYHSKKLNVNSSRIRPIRIFGFIGLIVFFLIDTFGKIPVASDLIKCKSYYFYANILKHGTNKMFDLDILTFANKYQEEFPGRDYISKDYPFLHKFENENKLGNYLNSFEGSPNIIVLITESLSEYFIHPIRGIEFMPFLDSLSKASLYWPNHLSVGERSFAVNPAINAAVPYGEIGFSLLEVYPYHFSLVNILKKNNYYTSFYYGQGSWFHNKNHFYTFNNIDRIIDKNVFDTIFEKVLVGDEKNFWGFNDLDLFNQYLKSTDSIKDKKRFDIMFTGTSHAPFAIKNPEYYNTRFNEAISKVTDPDDLEHLELYKRYYLSLYNVDDAYRNLFDSLKKRSDFDQSIFIFTGDHAMTELPRFDALKPYKVPLMIYSPKLKKADRFEEVCSHNDIYETLLSYLNKEYGLKIPDVSTSLGNKIKFEHTFDQSGTYVFMNNNRQIVDIYSNGYYLYKDKYLFKVYNNLEIKEIVDPMLRNKMRQKLYSFHAASLKASTLGGLMPDSLFFNFMDQKVFDHNEFRDSTFILNDNYVIANTFIPTETEIICDISFNALSETSSFPKIKLDWMDQNNMIVESSELIYPYEKSNYQFHYTMKAPNSKSSFVKLKVYFLSNKNQIYSIKNLKYTIYSKGPAML